MTREPTYAAMFAFFAGLTGGGAPLFKTATRNLAHWDTVPGEDCPCLLLRQGKETARYKQGMPTVWTLSPMLWLYVRTNFQNDPNQIVGSIINPLVDAIEASIKIDDFTNHRCTLGGIVSHCAIQGTLEIIEGTMGDEAVAIIPLEIVVSP